MLNDTGVYHFDLEYDMNSGVLCLTFFDVYILHCSKSQTIGDCYVAVTGLPEPRPDHATIMAKFAAECMSRLQLLLNNDMVDEYGESTRDLRLRVGIHSGPVTAGVLRGDRGRFQLFGDSVNTAARMESTGMPGKIQCSQATADLLLLAGKGEWLIAREGLVEAKGKGEMQTYWIKIALYQKSRKSNVSASQSSASK
jgi:class 3 adenylate cyclase